ncbi:uncharacterized protein [Physcomitrium patens]|uniref:Uncharacterized protein n=1 Tax=Physcomitrium patens TaxID=3218 RepID=A0A2K1INJ5_PHYPA|nr:uncharacterized protein LOC112274809 [Physcomitrium patens]PNR30844.1 hypothetical protein PHYPA_027160 [Physcomitrium patens]|eukprot:XP_024360347.1 uncharacterized protein LOC112274809 [Physcomitrella patens]
MAAMAETVGERKVADGQAPFLDQLSARGFNAEASDVADSSKPAVHDLPKLQPCGTPKEQDNSAMQISIAAADSVEMKALQHVVESLETRLQDALMQAILQVLESLGKEAAARVIMAERKASIMEQEHISTKQQALAMILRMKHSSDSMLIDAEKRLRSEQRRSQELDAKVSTLQDKIRRMQAELKRKGDILEEIQRHSDVGIRSGMTSPSEGVSKKRKGNPLVRPIEVKASQRCDEFVEDECDDTATVLTPSTEQPNSVLSQDIVQTTPRNSSVQECSRAVPMISMQRSPTSLRRHGDDGNVPKFVDKEFNSQAGSTVEQTKTLVESKGTRGKCRDVEEDLDSSDQHDSSMEGPSQNAEKKARLTHDSSANGEEMEVMADGFLGLIALQGAPPMSTPELQNGGSVSGLKLEQQAETDTNSSTDDEDEYQSKQGNADQNMQLKSDEVSVHHKVPGYTSERLSKSILIEPTMVLRRSSTGRNRGKQSLSPEKPGVLAVKEKELKTPGDTKGVESTVSAKSKGGVVHGSSNLVVESSRDSRRLMQGARQLLSLRKL